MLRFDLSEELENITEFRTNLRNVVMPNKDYIERVFSLIRVRTIKPFLPIRDLILYDTLLYFSTRYMILSGGYGINTCFFPPDERRLSLADIDFIYRETNIEEAMMLINEEIIRDGGAIILSLGKHEVPIGLISLNTKKMRWLRQIGADNIYSYRRTVLLPPVGHYVIRGEPLLDYLKRHNFSSEGEWRNVVSRARKYCLENFRVETIEIDITIMDANYVVREPHPAFELLGGENYVVRRNSVMVIDPNDAVDALKEALQFFYKKEQIHNAVKTLIDLRLAKVIGREKELAGFAEKIMNDKKFLDDYDSGSESWRFALLKLKYPTLKSLIEKWFLR